MDNRESNLQESLNGDSVVLENVIACAASNENDDMVSVFFYPREGATNFRYFETENATADKNDFSNYYELHLAVADVFNGYLAKFEVAFMEEKWVVVTFDEAGKTHVSNPIRIKHETKPTEYLPENIRVDSEMPQMPQFTWEDGLYTDSAIYFQVISNADRDLISGTYTYEKLFQFYELENVVLNITKGTPSALKENSSYNFTLLSVSEDNWVNQFSEVSFIVNK